MKRILKNVAKRARSYAYSSRHCQSNNIVPTALYAGANDLHENVYKNLDMPEDVVLCEYLWHGAEGELRGKTKVYTGVGPDVEVTVDMLDNWSYDGSSTAQASGGSSDIKLVPQRIFKDPFRGGRHILVLCETFDGAGAPLSDNARRECTIVRDLVAEHDLWFAFEQEYVIYQNGVPIGWPEDGSWPYHGQGPYYCAVGAENVYARNFVESHMRACFYAGLQFGGINAEVMCGQWEYQLGTDGKEPCDCVEVGDQLEISRYFLHRIGEQMNLSVTVHPKPVEEGGWNGSGNHINCSSREMRDSATGLEAILDAIGKLEAAHNKHIQVYGKDNEKRLSGRFETQHIGKFSSGVADRGSSIRIQRSVFDKGFGFFEDRRPASNCDPYLCTARIAKTLYDLNDLEIKFASMN